MNRFGLFRVANPVLIYARSTPWYLYRSTVGWVTMSRIMSSHIPSDPDALEKAKSLIDKTKEFMMKRLITFRKKLGVLCREMLSRDSFTFRLESRTDFRYGPTCDDPQVVDKGLAYHVYNADWIAPDDIEFKKFVEDDDRYRVEWGSFVKDESDGYTGTVTFIPNAPLPDKQKKKQQSPSDPVVLEKARILLVNTDASLRGIYMGYRKELRPLCLLMSPKDSFTYRLTSRTLFDDGLHFLFQKEIKTGLAYHVVDSDWRFLEDKEFKDFVEEDDRYCVDWGNMVELEDTDLYHGTIIFKPKDPLMHMLGFDEEESNKNNRRNGKKDIRVLMSFHKKLGLLCRLMSPEDSFEFRLNSRSFFDDGFKRLSPGLVKFGLVYHFISAHLEFPDDNGFKSFVEDDDRYHVDWGNFYTQGCKPISTIIYQSKERVDRPSNPAALRAARQLFVDNSKTFRKKFRRPEFGLVEKIRLQMASLIIKVAKFIWFNRYAGGVEEKKL